MEKYIHNLGLNVSKFVDSHPEWNEDQRNEFKAAYTKYMDAFKAQMKDGTSRFSTDDFGTISDADGVLNNTDDDGIDPSGSEYYYNTKTGERITTDDYNLLKDSSSKGLFQKKKNHKDQYKTFDANRQVARYFNDIGKLIGAYEAPKFSTSGFQDYWNKKYNPGGETIDWNNYIDIDPYDQKKKKRGLTNRSNQFAQWLEDYANSVADDTNFEGTGYADYNDWRGRINEAITNLRNGKWDTNDRRALTAAGIDYTPWTDYFTENKTYVKPAATAATTTGTTARTSTADTATTAVTPTAYDNLVAAYGGENSGVLNFGQALLANGKYNPEYNNILARELLNQDFSTQNAGALMRAIHTNFWDNPFQNAAKYLPTYYNYITHNNTSASPIASTDGYYILPNQAWTNKNGAYLAYNPVERILRLMRAPAQVASHQQGGTLGGDPFADQLAAAWAEAAMRENQSLKGYSHDSRSAEGLNKGNRTGFTAAEWARLATVAADISAIGAAFVPGYGTALSAGLGVGSTLTNFGIDVARDGLDRDDFKNLGISLGADFLGLIPGIGTTGKSAKIVSNIAKIAPKLMTAFAASQQFGPASQALSKLMSEGGAKTMTADDWANLGRGVQLLAGGVGAGAARHYNHLRTAKKNAGDAFALRVKDKKTGDIKDVIVSDAIAKRINASTDKNKELKKLAEHNGFELVTSDKFKLNFKREGWKPWNWFSRAKASEPITSQAYAVNRGSAWDQFMGRASGQPAFGSDRFGWNRMRFGGPKHRQVLSEIPVPAIPKVNPTIQSIAYQRGRANAPVTPVYPPFQNANAMRARKWGFKKGGVLKAFSGATLDMNDEYNKWYSGVYTQGHDNTTGIGNLDTWTNQLDSSKAGPSITAANASHGHGQDLAMAAQKNKMYTSNSDLVRGDLQNFFTNNASRYNGNIDAFINDYNTNAYKIRSYWNSPHKYGERNASQHNQLFKSMFKNRSGDGSQNYDIGYDPNEEDILGSSTWMRRMDRYEKEWSPELSTTEKKARTHKIDMGSGKSGYVYKKANGDIASMTEDEYNQLMKTPDPSKTDAAVDVTQQQKQKETPGNVDLTQARYDYLRNDRYLKLQRANRDITDYMMQREKPTLHNAVENHWYQRTNLPGEMQAQAAAATNRANTNENLTNDAQVNLAAQIDTTAKDNANIQVAMDQSSAVGRENEQKAWTVEAQNKENLMANANTNTDNIARSYDNITKLRAAQMSQAAQNEDQYLSKFEYDAEKDLAEHKAAQKSADVYNLHTAVWSNPNAFTSGESDPNYITASEQEVINKILSGTVTAPSELSTEDQKIYAKAAQKIAQIKQSQQQALYNTVDKWAYARNMSTKPTTNNPGYQIAKKGTKLGDGAKIHIAKLRARQKSDQDFLKYAHKNADRHDKKLARLDKSMNKQLTAKGK